MSIAGITFVTLLLLVAATPGIVFLFGLYSPMRFPRVFGRHSPLGDVATATILAAFVHFILFEALSTFDHRLGFNIHHSLATFFTVADDAKRLETIIVHIRWIFAYVLASVIFGFAMGYVCSILALRNVPFFSAVSKHKWATGLVRDLRRNTAIRAAVLTRIQEDENILMYDGYVKEFFIAADGTVSYLILTGCRRFCMSLADGRPRIPPLDERDKITRTVEGGGGGDRWDALNFIIEGADISNVVFHSESALIITRKGRRTLDKALAEAQRPDARGTR